MSPPPPPDSVGPADGLDWTGRVIAGRYRVDSVLGVGGMGTAYRAYDQKLERSVVLKVPHARHFSAGESRGRFQDEIRKLIAIEHPHVVRVYDVGDEDGTPYAVFPFLAGGSLGARMKALGQRLTPDEVVPWLTQVADALDDLHARGDIHRDVKPDNILFDKPIGQGKANAYLADFGLAKALGIDPDRLFQSRTGVLIGTQAYMAPEQFSRRAPVTGAVDQYALATTVYQALSGRMPFAVSSSEELAVAKAIETPRPLSEVAQFVSNSIERAVMRGLATDPKARFRTCAEFAAAVASGAQAKTVESTGSPPARAPASAREVDRWASEAAAGRARSRWPWIAAAVVILGGLGGAGAFLGWFGGGETPSRPRETGAVAPTPVPAPVAGAGMDTPTVPPAAPVTPPAMEADPAPAAMATVPPAEPAMVETPPPPTPPVVPVAPAWRAHIDAAKAAGKAGDWALAGRELDLALEKEVPSSDVPKFLEDGVRDWRAPATLTITSPTDPTAVTTVTTETVEVRWTLSTPRSKDAASVTVNGKAVAASSPGRATVSLVEGENQIEFAVRDEKGGERAKESVRVIREKDVSVVPPWAKVSADQIAEAKRLKVPVAFENSIGMRFVLVPAGTFTMGSPEGEKDRDLAETQHRVTLAQSYYVSIHEATNGQYRRFKKDHDSGKYQEESLNGDTQPVVNVSHTEAVEFATWLSGQESGRPYRLPTESEWEYACRAGTSTRFSFGDRDEDLPRFGNFSDKDDPSGAGMKELDDGASVTAPVGRYAPNGWGLHDMHGNVWEWCADWRADYPTGTVTDPTGPSSGTRRVLRGGSWHSSPGYARAANRSVFDPDVRRDNRGFRLVLPARAAR